MERPLEKEANDLGAAGELARQSAKMVQSCAELLANSYTRYTRVAHERDALARFAQYAIAFMEREADATGKTLWGVYNGCGDLELICYATGREQAVAHAAEQGIISPDVAHAHPYTPRPTWEPTDADKEICRRKSAEMRAAGGWTCPKCGRIQTHNWPVCRSEFDTGKPCDGVRPGSLTPGAPAVAPGESPLYLGKWRSWEQLSDAERESIRTRTGNTAPEKMLWVQNGWDWFYADPRKNQTAPEILWTRPAPPPAEEWAVWDFRSAEQQAEIRAQYANDPAAPDPQRYAGFRWAKFGNEWKYQT